MAGTAEQAIVLEPALTATVGNGNDVVRFPARPAGAPGLARGAILSGRLAPRPFAVCFDHVESAEATDSFVSLFDLAPHVPRTAADLPFVNAGITAERPPRPDHAALAPAADRLPRLVAFRNSPLI